MDEVGSHGLRAPAPGMRIHHIESSMMAVNTYIVLEEAARVCAVIDPGFHNPDLFTFLDGCGCAVRYIVATHGHGDHTALIPALKERYGGEVCIHEADAGALRGAKGNRLLGFFGMAAKPMEPDRLLQGGECLPLGDLQLEILHTPGHSPGGICIKLPPYLISGDTLFFNTVGRTDFSGGSAALLRHSISVLLGAIPEDLQVLPGHGVFTTLAHEKANDPWFTRDEN